MKRFYSRRDLLQSIGIAGGLWLYGPWRASPHTVIASTAVCSTTIATLRAEAATVEGLLTTFYYTAITTSDGFFAELPTAYQRYLRLSLDTEQAHYRLWVEQQGAQPAQTQFYFPRNLFAAGSFSTFLATLDTLERVSIAFYLAAIRQASDQGDPALAAICGQLVGSEAEHRVMGREMAQNSPPAPNDLCYERTDFACAVEVMGALASYLNGGADFSDPVALPEQAQVSSAVGTATCTAIVPATVAACAETKADLLATAATAEALGITFYYHAIQGGIFAQLITTQQWYLQAALDEERHHLAFLLDLGAPLPPSPFFFPPGVFDELASFLDLLDTLENAFISAYLAAIQRFQALGEPLLAEIAGQILGVEAEHRVLGRVLRGEPLPHNRCLAQAAYSCVGEANVALTAFINGSADFTLEKRQPSTAEIDQAVDRFGCTSVPLAALPMDLYLPLVSK